MNNVKRTNLEIAGSLLLSACFITSTLWLMRNYTANEVKKACTEKDKEHADELRKFKEQRQKEIQMLVRLSKNSARGQTCPLAERSAPHTHRKLDKSFDFDAMLVESGIRGEKSLF